MVEWLEARDIALRDPPSPRETLAYAVAVAEKHGLGKRALSNFLFSLCLCKGEKGAVAHLGSQFARYGCRDPKRRATGRRALALSALLSTRRGGRGFRAIPWSSRFCSFTIALSNRRGISATSLTTSVVAAASKAIKTAPAQIPIAKFRSIAALPVNRQSKVVCNRAGCQLVNRRKVGALLHPHATRFSGNSEVALNARASRRHAGGDGEPLVTSWHECAVGAPSVWCRRLGFLVVTAMVGMIGRPTAASSPTRPRPGERSESLRSHGSASLTDANAALRNVKMRK